MQRIPTLSELIELYGLQAHPEGGFYRETYRPEAGVDLTGVGRFSGGTRCFSTAIYYLLPAGSKSRFHRIASDEVWHFYLGGPMTLVELSPQGELKKTTLGQNLTQGEWVQAVVPAGHWFGAFPNVGTDYSFVGCTVAPGFDFRDFEMGRRSHLLSLFPHAREVILQLTETEAPERETR